jgi:hypothetical protein
VRARIAPLTDGTWGPSSDGHKEHLYEGTGGDMSFPCFFPKCCCITTKSDSAFYKTNRVLYKNTSVNDRP